MDEEERRRRRRENALGALAAAPWRPEALAFQAVPPCWAAWWRVLPLR